jgi:hypothetical protein
MGDASQRVHPHHRVPARDAIVLDGPPLAGLIGAAPDLQRAPHPEDGTAGAQGAGIADDDEDRDGHRNGVSGVGFGAGGVVFGVAPGHEGRPF